MSAEWLKLLNWLRRTSRDIQVPDLLDGIPATTTIESASLLVLRGYIELHSVFITPGRPGDRFVHHPPGQTRSANIRGHIERNQLDAPTMQKKRRVQVLFQNEQPHRFPLLPGQKPQCPVRSDGLLEMLKQDWSPLRCQRKPLIEGSVIGV